MIFDEFTNDIWKLLPTEIWFIIRSIYIRNFLKDNLIMPVAIPRRVNHGIFADFWQAYAGLNRWDIETGNISHSTLICQYSAGKRIAVNWSGEEMLAYEQVFGIAFGISRIFIESIFPYADYLDFIIMTDSDEDPLFED